MPLDFYYLSSEKDSKEYLKIKDSNMHLFDNAFYELQKKTGVFIDYYGKCKIYPDHLKLLVILLEKKKEPIVLEFLKFIRKAILLESIVIADGD